MNLFLSLQLLFSSFLVISNLNLSPVLAKNPDIVSKLAKLPFSCPGFKCSDFIMEEVPTDGIEKYVIPGNRSNMMTTPGMPEELMKYAGLWYLAYNQGLGDLVISFANGKWNPKVSGQRRHLHAYYVFML